MEQEKVGIFNQTSEDRECICCLGLEELVLSANRTITNAGWTELFFSVSFNSRIRRLALDFNILDNTIAAMLSMVISSR
jgi:hypothetical protein